MACIKPSCEYKQLALKYQHEADAVEKFHRDMKPIEDQKRDLQDAHVKVLRIQAAKKELQQKGFHGKDLAKAVRKATNGGMAALLDDLFDQGTMLSIRINCPPAPSTQRYKTEERIRILIFEQMRSVNEIYDLHVSCVNEDEAEQLVATTAYVRIPCFEYKYALDVVNSINMTRTKSHFFEASFETTSVRHQKPWKHPPTAWDWSFIGEKVPDKHTKSINDPAVINEARQKTNFLEKLETLAVRSLSFSLTDVSREKTDEEGGLFKKELDLLTELDTFALGKLIMSAPSLHAVLHDVSMFIMMKMERLRCYQGLCELQGNEDLMPVTPRDHFLTLDAPFPLSMDYVKDAQGNIKKEFIHPNIHGYRDPDQQHPQMSGLLAIKYLMTEGHTISFIKCGVILAGSVSDICDGNQKRRIISLLRKYVGQEFSSQIKGSGVPVLSTGSSSSSSWAPASATSVVLGNQGPRDGQYSEQHQWEPMVDGQYSSGLAEGARKPRGFHIKLT